jgi:serine/threonine protein kinase
VKKLFNTHLHENKFIEEVECLMKAKHKNVVRFLRYFADTQGKMERYNGKLVIAEVPQILLCFEYLPKVSLHDYINSRVM